MKPLPASWVHTFDAAGSEKRQAEGHTPMKTKPLVATRKSRLARPSPVPRQR